MSKKFETSKSLLGWKNVNCYCPKCGVKYVNYMHLYPTEVQPHPKYCKWCKAFASKIYDIEHDVGYK